MVFPDGAVAKKPSDNVEDARDMGLIPGSGRSPGSPVFLPGKFHGKGAWQATVHGVTKSQTQLSTHT